MPPTSSGADLFRLVGDIDGDGYSDAVARMTNGDLIGLRGSGDGRFDRLPARIGSGWQIFDLIEPVGDYHLRRRPGPPRPGRHDRGELRIYPMTRTFGFPWRWSVATRTGAAPAASPVSGAVNGDANADVVVLRTDGSVASVPRPGARRAGLLRGATHRARPTLSACSGSVT